MENPPPYKSEGSPYWMRWSGSSGWQVETCVELQKPKLLLDIFLRPFRRLQQVLQEAVGQLDLLPSILFVPLHGILSWVELRTVGVVLLLDFRHGSGRHYFQCLAGSCFIDKRNHSWLLLSLVGYKGCAKTCIYFIIFTTNNQTT